ncbi:MAG: hypothetical protein ACOX5R_15555 [bacterium]|jgi:hypothetical protein
MDKRKLYRDIARVRKQIFAFTTCLAFLTVALATLLGHGMNFYLVFQNSIFAILVFGCLSYAWGILYEKIIEKPLVESYRDDARKRIEELRNAGGQRLAMSLSVSELTPGMKTVDPVHGPAGELIVRAGAILNDRMIQILRENNIASVKVEAQRQIPEEEFIEEI